jgi:hypothetical protein
MADVLLSGTVSGFGSVSVLTPIKTAVMSGQVAGLGDLTALTFSRIILFGGQAHGYGEVGDHLTIILDGTFSGQGDTQAALYRVLPLSGSSLGTTALLESILGPALGVGILSGYMETAQAPCPISCTLSVPTFRWLLPFPPGELAIAFTDAVGNPYAPVVVLFRLLRVMPSGVPYPVGPFNRRPVPCKKRLGVYYVTGMAGEGGQPGDWLVEWRWQRSPYDPPTVERRPFKVLDAVLAGDTTTCRCPKYGWGD